MRDCNIEMALSGPDSFNTAAQMLSGLSDDATEAITDLHVDAQYAEGGSTDTVLSGDQAVPNAIWLLSGMAESQRDAASVEISTRSPTGELHEMPPDSLTSVSGGGEQPSGDTETDSDGDGADSAESGDSHSGYPGEVVNNSRGHYVLWLLAQMGATSVASAVTSRQLAESEYNKHGMDADAVSTETSRLFFAKSFLYRETVTPTQDDGMCRYVYFLNNAGEQEAARLGEPADDPDDLLFKSDIQG